MKKNIVLIVTLIVIASMCFGQMPAVKAAAADADDYVLPKTDIGDLLADDNNYPNFYGRFFIPGAGLNVALYNDSSQAVCDRWDSASFFSYGRYNGMIIADHCNQEFAALLNVYPGLTGQIVVNDGTIIYITCMQSFDGHNDGSHLTDANYNNVMGQYDYLAYTCLNNWQNVRICQFSITGYGYCEPGTFDYGQGTPAPAPEPEVIPVLPAPEPEPAPAPAPEPIIEEPAPTPEPIIEEPTPEPAPEPIIEEPAPEPTPEPIIEEPAPAPEPIIEEPTPEPAPEPIIEEPAPAPEMEPAAPAAGEEIFAQEIFESNVTEDLSSLYRSARFNHMTSFKFGRTHLRIAILKAAFFMIRI